MSGIDDSEIEDRMGYHPATPDAAHLYDKLRQAAIAFAKAATRLTPAGREQSLMVTHIEDALMWGSKAIARTTPADLTDTARVARVLPSAEKIEQLGVDRGPLTAPTEAPKPSFDNGPQTPPPMGSAKRCACGSSILGPGEKEYVEGGRRHVPASTDPSVNAECAFL